MTLYLYIVYLFIGITGYSKKEFTSCVSNTENMRFIYSIRWRPLSMLRPCVVVSLSSARLCILMIARLPPEGNSGKSMVGLSVF